MKGCECRSGFFALRDCDQVVARTCSRCNRGVCSHHLSPASDFTVCLDCWARDYDKNAPEQVFGNRKAAFDEDWTYAYRQTYYRSGYRPIYTGTAASSYYNTYDMRSFDDDVTPRSDDDVSDSGFGDS